MDEPALKHRIAKIVQRMQELVHRDLDEMAISELRGLANEMNRLENELSDSRLRVAIRNAVNLILGGLAGYAIGLIADSLGEIMNIS